MHLYDSVQRISAVLLAALLSGCAGKQLTSGDCALTFQQVYGDMTGCTASAVLTADYGERVYEYTVDCTGTADSGTLTVTAPENIAGCSVSWQDGGTTLDYAELSLETGALSEDGFSPVDAVPTLLECCRSGTVLAHDMENGVLYLELQNPAEQRCTVSCWCDTETWALGKAELAQDGKTVITLEFTSFRLEQPEQETE